jgi:hypothetical protein
MTYKLLTNIAKLRFDSLKAVVKSYALLINLVYRQQPELLKVTTSIASQNLTVTDPEPSKPTSTNQMQDLSKPISTNHFRVHHGCQDSLHSVEVIHFSHES